MGRNVTIKLSSQNKDSGNLDGAIFENAATNEMISKLAPHMSQAAEAIKDVGDSVDKNTQATKDANKSWFDFSDMSEGASEIMSNVAGLAGDVYKQTADVQSTYNRLEGIIIGVSKATGGLLSKVPYLGKAASGFTSVMKFASGVFKGGLKEVVDYTKVLDEMSQTGLSFTGDLFVLKNAAASTGLEIREFQGVIGGVGESLAGVGGTMSQSALMVSEFAKDFKFQNEQGFESLRRMGMGYEEITEVLAKQMTMNRMANFEDEAVRQKQMESAVLLATEMDVMSKLTGKSRKELQDEVNTANMSKQTQMQIMRQQALGNEEVAESVRLAKLAAAGYGDGAKLAMEEIIAWGNVVTPAARQFMNAAGPAADEILRLGQAAKAGEDVGEELQALEGAMAERLSNTGAMAAGTLAGMNDTGDAYADLFLSSMGKLNMETMRRSKLEENHGKSMAQIREEIEQEARDELAAQKAEAETPGQALNNTIKQTNDMLKTAGTGFNTFLLGPNGFVQGSAAATGAINKFGNSVGELGDWMSEKMRSEVTEKIGSMDTMIGEAEDKFDQRVEIEKRTNYNTSPQGNDPTQSGHQLVSYAESPELKLQPGHELVSYAESPELKLQQTEAQMVMQQVATEKKIEELTANIQKLGSGSLFENNDFDVLAHTLTELKDSEEDLLVELYPKIKALGNTPEELAATLKANQKDSETMAHALLTELGVKSDVMEGVIQGVEERIGAGRESNEDRNIFGKTWDKLFGDEGSIPKMQTESINAMNMASTNLGTFSNEIRTSTTTAATAMNMASTNLGTFGNEIKTSTTTATTAMNIASTNLGTFSNEIKTSTTTAATAMNTASASMNALTSNIQTTPINRPAPTLPEIQASQKENVEAAFNKTYNEFQNENTQDETTQKANNDMSQAINTLTEKVDASNKLLQEQTSILKFSAGEVYQQTNIARTATRHRGSLEVIG